MTTQQLVGQSVHEVEQLRAGGNWAARFSCGNRSTFAVQCDGSARTAWTEELAVIDPDGVQHGHHTRRSAPDPLAPLDAPTWLVVRDMCGLLLEITDLPPRADQRLALVVARAARVAAGWRADEIGPRCSQFFATRAGMRIVVGIERDPTRELRR